jgi:hypothetical protein
MTAIGPKECPNTDDLGAALDLAVEPLDRVRRVQLGPVFPGVFAPVRYKRQTVRWTV